MFFTDPRTDLACESYELHRKNVKDGILQSDFSVNGIAFTKVDIISDEASRVLGKPKGAYITAFMKNFFDNGFKTAESAEAIACELEKLIPDRNSLILVAGLGNRDITPDAIGPKTAEKIIATRHISEKTSDFCTFRPVAVLSPGVLAQTGMETAEIISCIASDLSPVAVILIDALASQSVQRLGSTVQLSDCGISPGSGVFNSRKEINSALLGAKVISVGVPTVVDAATLATDLLSKEDAAFMKNKFEINGSSLMITPREIDVILKRSSELLSLAINKALHPYLETEEIISLTN